jgi:hypothetical protein
MRHFMFSAFLLFVACSENNSSSTTDSLQSPDRRLGGLRAASALRPIAKIPLKEPESLRIVAPSGIAVSKGGGFFIADASEGVVHHYNRDGSFVGAIGRRGDGPGEFRTPAYPSIGPDGRLYVTDLARGHVAVFSSDQRFLRFVAFPTVSRIDQVAIDPNGRFWILGNSRDRLDDRVLTLADSSGKAIASFLPIARMLPEGSTDSLLWASSRRPSLAIGDSLVFVVNSIADSLWAISMTDLTVSSRWLGHPLYRSPVAPRSPIRSRLEHRKWLESNLLVANVAATKDAALVGYSRGLYFENDFTMASVVYPDRVTHMDSVPPVLGASGQDFVVLRSDDTGRFIITRFTVADQ